MKLCLAGLSCVYQSSRPILNEIPFMLESFYYFKDFQKPFIKSADLFLLDSGAFTFMNGAKGKVDWNEYLSKYINFINENDVQHFFELDIDVIVGYEKVKQMRARLESETGKKSIPVWHKSRGIDEYKRLVNDYDYIAIGGFVVKHITRNEYPLIKRLVKYAYDRGIKVHALGFTPQNVNEYAFYSCDSTSWGGARRFGKLTRFDGKTIKDITPKNMGCKKDKMQEIERLVLREWIKYQKYLNRSCRY